MRGGGIDSELSADGDYSINRVCLVYTTIRESPRRVIGSLEARTMDAYKEIDRGVVLATCNRFEVYMDGCNIRAVESIKSLIRAEGGTPRTLTGAEAVLHLFRVASGIESEIVGESEVLGQVREAWEQSLALGKATPLLNELFRHAIMVGKRARRETGVSRGKAGYSSSALRAASRLIGDLSGKSVALIGWGSINKKILEGLCNNYSPGRLVIVTRRPESVERSLSSLGCSVVIARYGDMSIGNDFDIVFIAVKGYDVIPYYYEKAKVIVDLSTPRRVPPGWSRGVVVDLEGILAEVRAVLDERKRWIPAVEEIINEEIEKFLYRIALRRASGVIKVIEEYRRALSRGNPEVDQVTRRLLHPIYEAIRSGVFGGWSLDSFINYIYNEYLKRIEGEGNAPKVPSIKA